MSQQEPPLAGSTRTPVLHSQVPPVLDIHGEPLPPFQSFPARGPCAPSGSNVVPPSGYSTAQLEPSSDVAHGSSRPVKGEEVRSAEPSHEWSASRQQRQVSTLPAFTPFPAASPSSRYAPPPDSRAQSVRPIVVPPPTSDSEFANDNPWSLIPPLGIYDSTPILRHSRYV